MDLFSVSIVKINHNMEAKMSLMGRRPAHRLPIGWWKAHREYTASPIFMPDQAGHVRVQLFYKIYCILSQQAP